MQRQGSLALAIVDARLHEAGVDLAAQEVPRVHLVEVDALRPDLKFGTTYS